MKTLYAHQKRFLDKNPNKALLLWEGGTGKTIAACEWIKLRPTRQTLVVCPKNIVEKWKRDLKEWGAEADVISRDGVKKYDLTDYDCLVLDEAQDFASPLFDKGSSARARTIYDHIRKFPDTHVLLLSATPVRSTPWNIHTLACYIGRYWDVKTFKKEFFHLTDTYGHFHYEKNKGWQKKIRPYVERISDIVLMSDCVDVPKQHHVKISMPWTPEHEADIRKLGYLEPAAEWHARHRRENGPEKFAELQKILDQYRKVIVVCHYRSQIDDYVERIGDDRQVFVLHGDTPDQDGTIQAAREADDCIFIVQAQMGAGFDAAEFSIVVFASMSFRYVDYVQMKFRVKRINNLHENTFIHITGGACDEAVYNTIQNGQDFDPLVYLATLR